MVDTKVKKSTKKKAKKSDDAKTEVKYITSLLTAVPDKDGLVKHLQFTVIQEIESGLMRCFFDVVDPSKVKLADDPMSEPDNA